ncbi:hypothetical protein [Mesorhizobium sp. L-8-3]|uniref:hypothetical protein n=1 Tax=Mesorhizobium sp. L-8-3 TaxID=2744522 RepID=UPI0019286163|nr:hypothetical protein [Mesorhizobium sp. L-8-3]
MSDQASSVDLLERRLTLVGEVSAFNAQALRLVQMLAGAEMEMLRLELEAAKTGARTELVQDLHEAEEHAAAIQVRLGECNDRIAEVEQEVTEIDRLLAMAPDGRKNT